MDNLAIRFAGQPQYFAGDVTEPVADTPDLTRAELQPVIDRAVADLADGEYDVSGLEAVEFHLTDLPGSLLGWTEARLFQAAGDE